METNRLPVTRMRWSRLLAAERPRSPAGGRYGGDGRSAFEKDYHRIVGSASFRRLQDKTQVFPLDKSDFVRTRLTHSLEVSSFAKSLGQTVCREIMEKGLDGEMTPETASDVCDVLLCAGLIHDLGNPPFGHFGETVIRDWFRDHLDRLTYKGRPLSHWLSEQMRRDFLYFEGNAQALRLVSRLHFMVDEHGMNLTYALLNTIIKYPVASTGIDKNSGDIRTKKMGYFAAEAELYRDIAAATGADGVRHPLAFLLEAADDIAYRTADMEDGFKKGMLGFDDLLKELRNYRLSDSLSDAQKRAYQQAVENLEERREMARGLGLPQPEVHALQNWLVSVQGRLIASAAGGFVSHYEAVMSGRYPRDLFSGSYTAALADALGDVAVRYIFRSRPIVKLEIAAGSILSFLLDKFVAAAVPFDTDEPMTQLESRLMSILSENYKNAYRAAADGREEGERLYLRLLLVTDFVCGMTDSYAKSLYQELNGI